MTATLRATSINFGGVHIYTDDRDLEATVQVVFDMLVSLLLQFNMLAIELRTLVQLHTIIARRIVGVIDTVEAAWVAFGEIPQRMAEQWVGFWFRLAWNYDA